MSVDRRHFITKATYLSGAFLFSACKTVGPAPDSGESFLKVSPVDPYIPLRVNWLSLSLADKAAFIEAVKSMKTTEIDVPAEFGNAGNRKLDLWAAQAECHQWYCVHRSSSFLPWHRSYLYHFELILRKKIRDNFRLPYWDWTKGQDIPVELQEAGFAEAMGFTRENSTIAIEGEAGAFKTKKWWQAAFTEIGGCADYDTIGGDIESSGIIESPYHNMVHVGIGGDMGKIPLAAKDPMFWLHHCNVDRLWSLWMDDLIKKGHARQLFPAVDVSEWLNQSFPNHFWTPEGTLTSATVKSSLFTEGLGYNYDTMSKTWALSDIPSDQATNEAPAAIDKVETPAEGLGLAEVRGSRLSLQFAISPQIFNSPQKLVSLRLKIFGLAVPRDTSMSYAVSLRIAGKTLALPEIGFFTGSHAGHEKGSIGISLNRYRDFIRASLQGSATGQLIVQLKDKNGKSIAMKDAVIDFKTDIGGYRIKLKAVYI